MGSRDNYIWIDGGEKQVRQAEINATASGDNAVVAAVTDRKIRVVAVTFVCADVVTTTWKSGTGGGATVLVNAMSWAQYGGMDVQRAPHGYFCETAAGLALNLSLSGAVNVRGTLNYVLV